MWQQFLEEIKKGNGKALTRCISFIENEYAGYEDLLQSLPASSTKIIGITGPSGPLPVFYSDHIKNQMTILRILSYLKAPFALSIVIYEYSK